MFPSAFSLRRIAEPVRGLVRPGLAAAAFALLSAAGTFAQTALEPADGGTDFKIQGEYSGSIGATPLGVQVIALGTGKFKAVFLPGGLPGQGWNGTDRIEAAGTLSGATASFAGSGYTASIPAEGTSLTGKSDKAVGFTCTKVLRASPTEGMPAPAGAVVLFDGTDLSAWKDGTASIDARKFMLPKGSSEASGAVTKQSFRDFHLHLEFRVPFMPAERGQQRGNSGVYLQSRDEVQILDSFGNPLDNLTDTLAAKEECSAFFQYVRPILNAAYPPLSWQTYDIDFIAARFAADGKTLTSPAVATVKWNGVLVQDKSLLSYPTLLGDPLGPAPGPLRFQTHGDSVYYRNIWVLEGNASLRPKAPSLRRSRNGATGDAARVSLMDGRSVRHPRHSACIYTGPEGSGVRHSLGATDDF